MRHLCDTCASLTIDNETVAQLNDGIKPEPLLSYESVEALANSAEGNETWRGCHLCALILRSLIPPHSVGTEHERSDLPKGRIFLEVVRGVARGVICHQLCALSRDYPIPRRGLPLILSLEDDDGARGQDVSPSTDSDEVISLISQWSTGCLKSHTDCRAKDLLNQWLPDRVIDVGPPDGSRGPRLVDTEGKVGKYATLSHRWTDEKKMGPTTKINLNARRDYLDLQEISPTFRDAIMLCRRLDIRFLWIDAICIIQNTDDWVKQSNNMMLIYELGWLNISVTVSETEPGIFQKRNPRISRRCKLPSTVSKSIVSMLPRGVDSDENSQSPVYAHLGSESLGKAVQEGFLAQRGWVFQERILSPRTVHFSRDEVYWECETRAASETVWWGFKDDADWRLVKFRSKKRLKNSDSSKSVDSPSADGIPIFKEAVVNFTDRELYDDWYDLVERYSTRKLTKESDRLPAIKGLAQAIYNLAMPLATSFSDEYGMGIWIRDIARGLLWARTYPPYLSYQKIEKIEALATFSWSSAGGPIYYPKDVIGVHKHKLNMPHFTRFFSGRGLTFAIILRAKLTIPIRHNFKANILASFRGQSMTPVGEAMLDYEIYRDDKKDHDPWTLPVICAHVLDASGYVWDHGLLLIGPDYPNSLESCGSLVLGLLNEAQRPGGVQYTRSKPRRLGIYRNYFLSKHLYLQEQFDDYWRTWERVPVYL